MTRRRKKEQIVEEINTKIGTVKNIDKPLYESISEPVSDVNTIKRNTPPCVGRWKIDSFYNMAPMYYYVTKKPKWITKFFMKHVFDCTWENETF